MDTYSKTIFFSTTNVSSQRYKAFVDFFGDNSLYINLMSNNKLDSIFRNVVIYILFFIPIFLILLIRLIFKDLRKINNILVPFPGVMDLIFLYPICRCFGINLIYDSFVNFNQTLIQDRKLSKNKIIQKLITKIDLAYIKLSDYIIVETEQIKDYYIRNYSKTKPKLLVLLSPRYTKSNSFIDLKLKKNTVLYYGSYVPLNGTEFIIEAANILKDKNIQFLMIGDGQDKEKCLNLAKSYKLKNVKFLDTVPFESEDTTDSLVNYINSSNLCLGTFSSSEKNDQVIPGKIVDALAFGKKIITSNTTCINYYLEDSVIKINSGSPKELSDKILEVLFGNQYDYIELAASKKYNELFSREVFFRTLTQQLYKI